ncbi:MAG TPA: hypothetical protein VF665_03830 [Longimicrobium sp.]|jgi:hypothetical protein|uniref:hypothetical protein n=1 Tax=Longimicrobium sp. TaxID=2029185 RepID=UPI002ED7E963
MRYDQGFGRGYDRGMQGARPRGYDFGLRGYSQTAPDRRPVGMRVYDRDFGPRGRTGGGYNGAGGMNASGGGGFNGAGRTNAGGGMSGMAGSYDAPYRGHPTYNNRVTQRYNRDYVNPQPNQFRENYNAFGGDFDQRIVDTTGYWRPYNTIGGSSTMRGGGMPMGWEREASYGRYDEEFRGYGRDFYGPMR